MRNLGNNPAGLRRAQLLKLMRSLDFKGCMNELIQKHLDNLKPDAQFDNHSDKAADIVSFVSTGSEPIEMTPSTSLSIGTEYDVGSLKEDANIVENNVSTFGPFSLETKSDIQRLLDGLDNIGTSENELWKEISDQAMWLGNSCLLYTSLEGPQTKIR